MTFVKNIFTIAVLVAICLSCNNKGLEDHVVNELIDQFPKDVTADNVKELCEGVCSSILVMTNRQLQIVVALRFAEVVTNLPMDRSTWNQRPRVLRRQRELSWKVSELLCRLGEYEQGMNVLVSNIEKYSVEILQCGPPTRETGMPPVMAVHDVPGTYDLADEYRNQCIMDLENDLGSDLFAWVSFWPTVSKRILPERANSLNARIESAIGTRILNVRELSSWRNRGIHLYDSLRGKNRRLQ